MVSSALKKKEERELGVWRVGREREKLFYGLRINGMFVLPSPFEIFLVDTES